LNLNKRETEILALIASGLRNREIGASLNIGEETVKSHVCSLLGKLGARNRAHAVALGLRGGLVE